MPKKVGDGGYGLEEYDGIDGKYSADGKPNNNGKLSQADKDVLKKGLELDDDDDIFLDEDLLEAEADLLLEELGIKSPKIKTFDDEDEYEEELEEQTFNESSGLDDFIKKLTSAFAPKPQQQSTKQYVRHDGETYEIPYDNINKLRENGTLKYYEIKEIDLQKFVEEKWLNNPSHGVFGRRPEIWGKRDEYHYDESKNDEGPIRLNSDMSVHDGNHRLFALYNDGYSKAQVLVKKNNDYLKREVNIY